MLISTPAYDGKLSTDYLLSLMETRELVDFDLYIVPGVHFVDTARDIAVAKFLKSEASHLFFIDSDLGWEAEAVIKMADAGKDIIGGAYPIKHDTELYPVFCYTEEDGTPQQEDGLIKAAAVPGGFMCISREVVEAVADSVPKYKFAVGGVFVEVPRVFGRELEGDRVISEDVMFCKRAEALGFTVWVYPHVNFTHVGEKRYKGHYGEFMTRRPGGSACS